MARNPKTQPLVLLVALLHVCAAEPDCTGPSDNNLSCYTDYNRIMTCVWNVTSEHEDECVIEASKNKKSRGRFTYKSCKLQSSVVSQPALKQCSMDIGKNNAFQSFESWKMKLKCASMKQSVEINFFPYCNIKLNPSEKPRINFTSVSWSANNGTYPWVQFYMSELQWKRQDESWTDPSVQIKFKGCKKTCEAELDKELLFQGATYEARTRVKPQDFGRSTWSDWSPTATWVSTIGKTKPPPDVSGSDLSMIVPLCVVFVLLLAVGLYKFDKTSLVYVVKKIQGPPIPNPASSFLKDDNLQSWLSPHFNSKSIHFFLKPVEITSVEVTSAVDAVSPCSQEAALLEKIRSEGSSGSSSSSYSNPSYSQVCLAPPISSLSAGNLEPCAADSPYGPVVQCKGENAEQSEEGERRNGAEIFELLSKGGDGSQAVPVVSDYEAVEKPQTERMRLQSLDSGVCSAEEVSEESLEADSINASDCHDEEPEDKEEAEEFRRLFGGTGAVFGKGSIQVCSDYERVQKLLAGSPELPSLDSGISSGGEEQASQEESPGGVDESSESTRFLFPPPSCPPPSSLSPFSPPLKFPGSGLSPALLPLPGHLLGRISLTSASRSVEPSSDGYMPVTQDES